LPVGAARCTLPLGDYVGEEHPGALELLAQRPAAVRLQQALHLLPGGGEALVLEDRHQMSSWVTLSTSARLVSPASTLRAPSSSKVRIPLATPACFIELLSPVFSPAWRISSSTISIS